MREEWGIFAKEPVPGRVKTRLTSGLTPNEAAAFYEASLRDVVARTGSGGRTITIFYDQTGRAADYFKREFPSVSLKAQVAGDLGARLIAAFEGAFAEGADILLVVGTDSPTLPVDFLDQAAEVMQSRDVCLGPSTDGGYYLIGIRATAWPGAAALFRKINWSTTAVLTQTLDAARSANLSVHQIPEWYDVDHPEDLEKARADSDADSEVGRWFARKDEKPGHLSAHSASPADR